MAYERYIEKNGKVYGPYLYRSIRDKDGNVKNIYVGRGSGGKGKGMLSIFRRIQKFSLKTGMKLSSIFVVFFLTLALFSAMAGAASFDRMTVQGQLRDSSNTVLTGNYNFSFNIYSAATGGTPLFQQNFTDMYVDTNGIYTATLTGIDLPFDQDYYLGIYVEDDPEMIPRLNLTDVGTAFRSNRSEYLGSNSPSYFLNTSTEMQTVSGNLTVSDALMVGSGGYPSGITMYSTGNIFSIGNLTLGTSGFFVDASLGYVGIGTSTPTKELTVNGSFLQTAKNPTLAGNFSNSTYIDGASGVYVSGKYAYVASYNNDSLVIIDVSNPASPAFVSNYSSSTYLDGANYVYISGRYAYVTSMLSKSLTVIDVSNPKSPAYAGNYSGSTYLNSAASIYVSGKYAYVASMNSQSLTVLDVSNPTSPTYAGNYSSSTYLNGARSVKVAGKYAYVASQSSNSLTVIDVSNPASPAFVSNYSSDTYLNGARSVYVSGRYAYVASYNSDSLTVIDVSNPASPAFVSNYSSSTYLDASSSVYVSGRYAYVASYNSDSLTVIDVSNPASPAFVSNYSSSTYLDAAWSVYVSGKYAYVISMLSDSLTVLDISGIDAPAATIGDLAVGTIDVWENADVKNDLSVGSGLVVGANGIYSQGNVTATSILANTSVCIGSDCRTEWPTGGGGGNTTDEMRTAINGSDITLSSLEVNKQVNLSGTLFVNESGVIGFGTANLNPWWSGYRAVDFTYSSLCANNGGTQIGLSSNAYMNATANWVYKTSAVPAAMYIQNSGTHDFRYASAGTAGNPITWSRGLYIDDSGRVGIGDNIYPDAELHVQGGACIDTDDACTDPGDGNLTAHSLIATTGMTLGGEYRTTWPSGDISNGSDVWFGNVGIGTSSPSSKLEVSGSGTNGLSLNVTGDLYVNDSSGRVGIGTTDPSTKLHIKDDDAHLSLEDASYGVVTGLKSEDYYGYVGTSSDFPFIVKTNSTNALFIDTSQEVGIGTTDPDAELHVKGGVCIDDNDACTDPGDGNLTAHSLIATTGMTLGGEYRTTWPSGDISNGSDVWFGSVGIGTESPTEKLHVHEGGVNISNSQNGTMMYIDNATGNVGIGTASPSSRLGIKQSADTFLGGLQLERSGATNTWAIAVGGDNNLYFGYDTAPGSLGDGDEKIVIQNGGNVGIGTASPAVSLDIAGTHVSSTGIGRITGTTHAFLSLNANDSGDQSGLYFSEGGTPQMQLRYNGVSNAIDFYDVSATATRMVIEETGKVGIGTASPSKELEVSDGTYGITFDPNDGADSYGIINTTGGTNLTIHSSGGSVIIKLGA